MRPLLLRRLNQVPILEPDQSTKANQRVATPARQEALQHVGSLASWAPSARLSQVIVVPGSAKFALPAAPSTDGRETLDVQEPIAYASSIPMRGGTVQLCLPDQASVPLSPEPFA